MSDQGSFGKMAYAVDYLLKGEVAWRRTMPHPLDYLAIQQEVLWDNPTVAATRLVAYCEYERLLNPDELEAVSLARSPREDRNQP